MGYFAELILEILLGCAKGTPEKMPDIDYKPSFNVCCNRKKSIIEIAVSFIIVTVFSILWIFIKHETRYLFLVFIVLGAMLLILAVISFHINARLTIKLSLNLLADALKRQFYGKISFASEKSKTRMKNTLSSLFTAKTENVPLI